MHLLLSRQQVPYYNVKLVMMHVPDLQIAVPISQRHAIVQYSVTLVFGCYLPIH